jgi:hypothetical protein
VWHSDEHPREPAGSPKGGEFAPKLAPKAQAYRDRAQQEREQGETPKPQPNATPLDTKFDKLAGEGQAIGKIGHGWNEPQLVIIQSPTGEKRVVEKQIKTHYEKENELLGSRLSVLMGARSALTEVEQNTVRSEFLPNTHPIVQDMSDPNHVHERFDWWLDPAINHHFHNFEHALVDFLMNQLDRNMTNVLIDQDGKDWLIDHGNTGEIGATSRLVFNDEPLDSPYVRMTAGWEVEAKDRPKLEAVLRDESFPKAVRARADFLLRYGKIPGGELAGTDLWNQIVTEYTGKQVRNQLY